MKLGIRIWIFGSLAIGCLWVSRPISAQIVPDATLPVNSVVTPQGNTITITGGTNAGGNLFHSFREFSLPAGSTAYFNNSPDIQNIITRVTGGSISNIDGTIKANGTANLFLLNPSGIIFCPNASLNIGGSFLASTASSIKLADGNEFSATNPAAPPLLTVNVPVGLQLGQNPGEIVVRGSNLAVQTGKTLALVGGNLTISGSNSPGATGLTAGGIPLTVREGVPVPTTPGGRIELGSVMEGNVSLTPAQRGFALGYTGVDNFGNIQLSGRATVDTSGIGGGEIQITARNLRLSELSRISSVTFGSVQGGDIVVSASESLELVGGGKFMESLRKQAVPFARLSDFNTGLFVLSYGPGNAGNLFLTAGQARLYNGAFIVSSSDGVGRGGFLTLNAKESVEVDSSALVTGNKPGSLGSAGNLTINTRFLTFRNLGIALTGTAGQGAGGTLTVSASESAEFIGGKEESFVNGLINTGLISGATSAGQAGDIRVATRRLILRNGGLISAAALREGQGGAIEINASESVELIGRMPGAKLSSGLNAAARQGGSAGSIRIATGRLTVRDGATVTVQSDAGGKAGNMEIAAGSVQLDKGGTLSAQTAAGDRGNIAVRSNHIQLRRNSNITTSATGTATGGNITLRAHTIAALENSDISANSQESFGGQVTINATGIFGTQYRLAPTANSDITATGGSPQLNGTVTINTPDADPTSGLIQLPSQLHDVTGLINNPCTPLARGSSFTVTGRGGIPQSPTDPLTGTALAVDWISPPTEAPAPPTLTQEIPKSPNPGSPPPLIEAQGWVISPSGTVTLTANPPTGTPHATWQPPSACPQSR